MFNKKKKIVIDSISSVLGESTRLNGKLVFSGTMRIDGNIKGEIAAKQEKGIHNTLIVGEKAWINGDVRVDTVINSGRINGNVYAATRIAIHEPGQLIGDVQTSELTVEEGVVFNGKCNMIR
ncbi:MAG: polymer-forming cytoskeletal protein [Candidatus Glassbacteria bacterium]|nr:polymer-forming cytoskeletal protein [Candidatus Glassbacteria bacterium]